MSDDRLQVLLDVSRDLLADDDVVWSGPDVVSVIVERRTVLTEAVQEGDLPGADLAAADLATMLVRELALSSSLTYFRGVDEDVAAVILDLAE